MAHGFWITRDPEIRKEEWRAFIANHADLRKPSEAFGEVPIGVEGKPNLPEFVWWTEGVPSKVLFSNGAVFIEAGGPGAATFAKHVASHFNAQAQEG